MKLPTVALCPSFSKGFTHALHSTKEGRRSVFRTKGSPVGRVFVFDYGSLVGMENSIWLSASSGLWKEIMRRVALPLEAPHLLLQDL